MGGYFCVVDVYHVSCVLPVSVDVVVVLFSQFHSYIIQGFLNHWMQWNNTFLVFWDSLKGNKGKRVRRTNSWKNRSFFQSQTLSLSLQGGACFGVRGGARRQGWGWSSGQSWGETNPAGLAIRLASGHINKRHRRPDSSLLNVVLGHSRSPPCSLASHVQHTTHTPSDGCVPENRTNGPSLH